MKLTDLRDRFKDKREKVACPHRETGLLGPCTCGPDCECRDKKPEKDTVCFACSGAGWQGTHACKYCQGTGRQPFAKVVPNANALTLPAGARLVLSGAAGALMAGGELLSHPSPSELEAMFPDAGIEGEHKRCRECRKFTDFTDRDGFCSMECFEKHFGHDGGWKPS